MMIARNPLIESEDHQKTVIRGHMCGTILVILLLASAQAFGISPTGPTPANPFLLLGWNPTLYFASPAEAGAYWSAQYNKDANGISTAVFVTATGPIISPSPCSSTEPCYELEVAISGNGTTTVETVSVVQNQGGPGQVCSDGSFAPEEQTCADESLGLCGCGDVDVSDPISVGSGNVFYQKVDYATNGSNQLQFVRYYNSRQGNSLATTLGALWRSNYDRYIRILSTTSVMVERPSGKQLQFTLTGGVWTPDTDVDIRLQESGTTWTLTDHDDTVETYTTNTGGTAATLQTIKARNGYTQILSYNSSGQLQSVEDSYSRSLSFNYNNGLLDSVETPDSTTLSFAYTSVANGSNLTSVTYPTSTPSTLTYVYGNTSLINALTGIIDENNNRYETWTYDNYSRGLTNQQGAASFQALTKITYNDATDSRTVTNALGVTDTYTFTTLQNKPKATAISRAATSTTAAATESITYDSKGYLASITDWNGNKTTLTNDSHGQPTTINEAVGSSVARTTTIAYDPTWVHLPSTITTSGLSTSYTYDSSGNQLTRKLTDTTTTTTPYSTKGQTRTWTKTWSNFLLASVKTPNGHTTLFGYDGTGALTSITDPLNHETKITSHTGGGLPEIIVDPNGVTTTDAYDPRQRIISSSIKTTAGALDTTWTYYNSGDVTTTLPDGSAVKTLLDSAHRLNAITDNENDQQSWTLDGNGDPVATIYSNPSGKSDFYRTASFDALGRKLKDTSTVTNASYVWTYDKNSNPLTAADPLSHKTTNVYDALNRLSTSTDANSGVVTTTYDAHNRPLTIKDKNGNITTFIYDGFGDKIEQVSPDTGTTVYHYDSDGNLTSRTDAASAVTNWTYDALDRPLTTTYPADSTENVAYTYDQTGHGFGIGRLTSLTDVSGSLSRTYDERGNILTDLRVNGTHTLTTTYTYDKVSRVASITYPSGSLVTYTRDSVGRPTTVAAKAPAATSVNLASSITYEPYGPITGIKAFNGDAEAFTFDADYRMTSLITTATNGSQNQTYTYDSADNLKTLKDTICASCSGSYSYDLLNRLTSASGWYGTYGYSYDKNGNFMTNGEDGYNATYAIASGSNRISSITVSGSSYPVTYTATGNISSYTRIPGETTTLSYNKANRLASTNSTWAAATYGYDAFGQRITKADPGTQPTIYTYDHSGNTLEENDNGTLYDYIWVGGRLIGTLTPATNILAFTHGDRLGSPMIATDKNALLAQSFSYTPYGNTSGIYTQSGAQTITQNNRLPGQFFDPETLNNHNGFRDYSPQLGRYVESDPIGLDGGLNTYAYAKGNPLYYTDRLGTSPGQVLYTFYLGMAAYYGLRTIFDLEYQPLNLNFPNNSFTPYTPSSDSIPDADDEMFGGDSTGICTQDNQFGIGPSSQISPVKVESPEVPEIDQHLPEPEVPEIPEFKPPIRIPIGPGRPF